MRIAGGDGEAIAPGVVLVGAGPCSGERQLEEDPCPVNCEYPGVGVVLVLEGMLLGRLRCRALERHQVSAVSSPLTCGL